MTRTPAKLLKRRWILAPLLLGVGLVVLMARSPTPERSVPPTDLGEFPASALTVSVEYSPESLMEALELRVPAVLGGLELRRRYPGDARLQYAFEAKRQPFEVRILGDTVHLSTVVQYSGQVWFQTPYGAELTASCGVSDERTAAAAPRAVISVSSPIGVDADWNVRAAVRVDRLEPLTAEDRCIVSVFQFQLDATDPILAEIRSGLEAEADKLNLALRATSLQPAAAEEWARFQEPIQLAEHTWLMLNPLAVGYRAGSGSPSTGHQLLGRLDLMLRPELLVGNRPSLSSRALPPLGISGSRDDSWVTVEVTLEYGAISEIATRAASGRSFLVSDRSVQIRSLVLSGTSNGKVAGELQVEGELPGTIMLLGTPVFDSVAGEVHFPDLTVSLENEDLGGQVAAWLLRTQLIDDVRAQARIPLAGVLADQLERLAPTIVPVSERATLEARVAEAEIAAVRAEPSVLVIRWRMRPEAVLRLR